MKILLAVDGSKASTGAATSLVERMHWYREPPSVELVTVQPPIPELPGMSFAVAKGEIERYIREEGEANLRQAQKILAAAANLLMGSVASKVLSLATVRVMLVK
jgi:nucleotide-binding universal stress UspA family protein